jgi:hypothetical protein
MASTTDLYSHNGEYPRLLPNRIRLSDGMTKTDVSTFSDEQISDAGYTGPFTIPVEIDDFDSDIEYVQWNTETVQFDKIQYTDEYLMGRVRIMRNFYLNWTDRQVVVDSTFTADQLTQIKAYRQTLRDFPANVADIKNVTWPSHPLGNDHDPRWLLNNNKISM